MLGSYRSKEDGKVCLNKIISCCQDSISCRRQVNDWLIGSPSSSNQSVSLAVCRHGSNGLMGAVREDNADVVRFFLHELTDDNLKDVFTKETQFGYTALTYAASKGRTDIVGVLLETITSVVDHDNLFTVYDIIHHETSRGKTALIEAVRSNSEDVVALLLNSGQANAKLPTKAHQKSAIEWALSYGHDNIVQLIESHVATQEKADQLFTAVSNHDMTTIETLTEGGSPFERNQDERWKQELESKCVQVDTDRQQEIDISLALKESQSSRGQLSIEIKQRKENISNLKAQREEIMLTRRQEIMSAVLQVRHSLEKSNDDISNLSNTINPPIENELIAKALCTILHIKLTQQEHPTMPHWKEIVTLLQGDRDRFYHRIRHYHFESPSIVELATQVQVDKLPGTISDHLPSILNNDHQDLSSIYVLMTSLATWLKTIFNHISKHKLEKNLLLQESSESDRLFSDKIDHNVLQERSAMLKRELSELAVSITANTNRVSSLRRMLEVRDLLKVVSRDGHSILSWAAGCGDEEIVKLLLKRGAHPILGSIQEYSASIIQIAYRNKRSANERNCWKQDLVVAFRIKSLSNLARHELKNLRLPLAEALCSGHSNIARVLDTSDLSDFQAVELFSLFCPPQGLSRSLVIVNNIESSCELLTSIIKAGQHYSHEQSPQGCAFVSSLKYARNLVDDCLQQRRRKLETKIATRKETIIRKHKNACANEMQSAIMRGDFVAIIKASKEGNISLDYECPTTNLTPLIKGAMEDVNSPYQGISAVGEKNTAVAYLLDRISPHRPNIDYENALGNTALAQACMFGRLEVIKDLMDRGADSNRKSLITGYTPRELAAEEKHFDIVEFLDNKLR